LNLLGSVNQRKKGTQHRPISKGRKRREQINRKKGERAREKIKKSWGNSLQRRMGELCKGKQGKKKKRVSKWETVFA